MKRFDELLNAVKSEIEDSYIVDSPDQMNYPGQNYERITRSELKPGDRVKNINSNCKHFGSEGIVESLEELPGYMGNVVLYRTTNTGETWKNGEILKKTEIQLQKI
jgi:hypothetical protein